MMPALSALLRSMLTSFYSVPKSTCLVCSNVTPYLLGSMHLALSLSFFILLC